MKICIKKVIQSIMKRKERIKEKVIESWKYYPISLLSPSVFIVIACAIIVFFIQQSLTDGTAKYLLDFLWKAAVGYAIKELMVITSGNPDIVTQIGRAHV